MKVYTPPKRLLALGLVLQFDREQKRLFAPHERFAINQERAKLMANQHDYLQPEELERRIQTAIFEIETQGWCPLSEIKFG